MIAAAALDWAELHLAAFVGSYREISALRQARPSGYGYDERDAWTTHIEAAGAEMALAKAANRYWYALADTRLDDLPGDIGHGAQVRSTPRLDGSLIVHPEDPDDHVFYLVVGRAPSYRIVGRMLGREAKQRQFWRADVPRPAFFVPQAALR